MYNKESNKKYYQSHLKKERKRRYNYFLSNRKDWHKRRLLKEYGELVAKYQMDFLAFPTFIPDDQGNWKIAIQTQVVSTKDRPIKSPFVPPVV